VTVTVTTVAGTALAGSDFQQKTQTLTFNPGVTTLSFQVVIVNDRTAEPTETFTVQITSVSGATIADGTGMVTIVDNDGALTAVEPAPAGTVVRPLTRSALDQAVADAKRIWRAMLPGADLGGVTFVVGDLPDLQLAFTLGDTVVVDATDFRSAPEEVMAAYCEAVDIPHRADALRWQPGPVNLWQGWSEWHRDAKQSASIAPPAAPQAAAPDALPERVAAMVDLCQPHYERLHAARLLP